MIRKRLIDVSEEEFLKIVEPHNRVIDNYIENIVYDFVAFYLAKGYELNALWECNLKSHVSSTVNTLEGTKFLKKFDYDKLKDILKNKYNLIITNENMLDMKEINK